MDNIQEWIVNMAGTLISGLKAAAGFIAARVLAALGLSFVTWRHVLPDVKAWLLSHATMLDQRVTEFFGYVGLDVAMTLIVSALVARVGMRAFLVGTTALQRMIQEAGG